MTHRLTLATAALAAAAVILFAPAGPGQQPATSQPPTTSLVPQPTDSLDGTWELVAVIEDGKLVTLDAVKQTLIKDARVVIKGQLASIVRPDGKASTLAFVTDSKANPKTVDLAGVVKTGGKGIYMRDGDTLVLCVSGTDGEARPTQFASLPGSDSFLMTFRKVAAPAPPTTLLPPVAPKTPAPVVPAADATRKILVGTWGHQTDDKIVKLTLNPDGSFSILETYKKGFKKVFEGEDRTSGSWSLKGGDLMLTVTASTINTKRGQVYSYRITSITESEVLYIDNQSGQRRIEWKLR